MLLPAGLLPSATAASRANMPHCSQVQPSMSFYTAHGLTVSIWPHANLVV